MTGRSPTPMPLPFGKANRVIFAGGYYRRPEKMIGIKMAEEIQRPCDIDVPTRDFSVPDQAVLLQGVKKALWKIALGKEVYVGCMGGIGRTGLFLAALVKTLGEPDAVTYVRANYYEHAVETGEQKRYIADLPTDTLAVHAKLAKITARVRDFF